MIDFTRQEFIRKYLIEEIEDIVERHPFHAFVLMAVGIEYLGIILSGRENAFEPNHSKDDFKKAINVLNSLASYRQYLDDNSFNLYTELRCGLNHAFMPKTKILLTSKNDTRHLMVDCGRLILRCEDFYNDFKLACEEVTQKLDEGILTTNNYKQKFSERVAGSNIYDLTSGSTMV